ncbi:MAG: hypothetical protein HIU90_02770 [Proteobacteria bacterium]|jgi:hypothetical protein|nr:hypothetical protein [Pseudomonadota bacterium]
MSGTSPGLSPAVQLEDVERGLSVKDRIALGDASIRRQIAIVIMALFAITNVLSVIFIGVLYYFDQRDIADHLIPATARVITPSVVMSLLGATTVQLGAIAVIMARGIFNVPIDQPYPIVEEG